MSSQFSRRDFCAIAGSAIASVALGSGCGGTSEIVNDGRLSARPRERVKTSRNGRIILDLDADRETILQIPTIAGITPVPLFVMLHGATQSAEDMFWYLGTTLEDAGIAVLAPKSGGRTWDAIGGTFGTDVAFLNRTLERVFSTVAVDPKRIAIGGFSDGASYAVSLGLINGDLFSSVIAFSPGFVINGQPHGKPRIFVSHGINDQILPIDRCGRRIASGLRTRGYDVTFREFDGGHEIPADVSLEGLMFIEPSSVAG